MSGLIIEKILDPRDYKFGSYTGIDNEPINPSGQWGAYLPVFESQWVPNWDAYACVSFSLLNCIEALIKFKYNQEVNFSDRYLATKSGTTCNVGNSMSQVANTLAMYGVPLESEYPFLSKLNSCELFYAEIIPSINNLAEEFTIKYVFQWEWISNTIEETKRALEYCPISIVVNNNSHVVMLYGYEEGVKWKCYDSYANKYKEYPWHYDFGARMKFNIVKRLFMPTPLIEIDNNTLVQDVQDTGAFGLVLDNKIIVDEPSLLLSTFIMRNEGNIGNKIKALTKEQWDSFEKINLRKEPI